MIKKNLQREKAIRLIIEEWGYNLGEMYVMSFWELADNLNNRWKAPLFLPEKLRPEKYNDRNDWAISECHLSKYKRMINSTIKRMCDIDKVTQKRNDFYIYTPDPLDELFVDSHEHNQRENNGL